ncbi:major facilitator superfamily domain-containing protein [Chaetomium tenue]|uniref:Major facilitator superfamily domain-containing protein n=1 Tax=Chaetomium tenue TaxID=1854479 RepID=A0ACB7P1K4_9PEZI|nr:major facilitator superfamily domain-containing protein [Chaetomium globosum]
MSELKQRMAIHLLPRRPALFLGPSLSHPSLLTANIPTASDEEDGKRQMAEAAPPYDSGSTSAEDVICPPHTTERKITTRIDSYIIPFVSILYLMAFLDRVNIGNARAFGLEDDLHMGGVEYNTALTIFFVPYIICEIPSNILIKYLSPRVWLSICCIGFGAVTVFQGLVQNYGGLLTTRFFLGLFECVMFPACFYLLGSWYRRAEAQKRFSLFFSSTSLAGAFGGLLASGIGKMDYVRGYRGWRWIFILEGTFTVLLGIFFLFTFPSFPEQAKWLRDDEREYVKARLRASQGASGAERKIRLKDVLTVMSDYKIWLGGFMYFGLIVPAYSYAYFAPTIIQSYKYDPITTQLRSVPPWVVSFGFSMVVAVFSDWAKHRFLFIIGAICIAISGFAILLTVHDNLQVQYAALFLTCMGTYSAMPVIVCWFNMNLAGHHRRAIGSAWQIGFGNIGGIISTYSFVKEDGPLFTKGYAICVSFICLSVVSCILYAAAITWENKKRSKQVHDLNLTESEKLDLGVHALTL